MNGKPLAITSVRFISAVVVHVMGFQKLYIVIIDIKIDHGHFIFKVATQKNMRSILHFSHIFIKSVNVDYLCGYRDFYCRKHLREIQFPINLMNIVRLCFNFSV